MTDETGKKKITRREVLAAILMIVSIAVFADWRVRQKEISNSQVCAGQLEQVRGAINKWIATVSYQNRGGSNQECNTAKSMVTSYDANCGPLIGTFPDIRCEDSAGARSSAPAAGAGRLQNK